MGYIEEMRQLVGHRPILLVGAAVLLTDEQGRLLLGLRSDNHCWGLPGGGMEPGEDLETTARRETREETGLKAGPLTLFGVYSGPQLFYIYPNGDQVYNVTVVYTCHQYSGALQNNDEHRTWQFFAPGELPEAISPPIVPIIRQWQEGSTSE